MGLALLCLKSYILGKVCVSAAHHKEMSMNGQPQNTPPLTALSPDERTRALERYRILQACVETGVPLTHIARDHGMSLRTAQRWLAQYRRDGFAGLSRR